MGDLLSFLRPRRFRRAASAQAAPQPPAQGVSRPESAAGTHAAEVVRIEDRMIPKILLPWCHPMPPYIGAVVLSAAISTTAAASIAADLSLIPGGLVIAALAPWSP